MQSTTHTTEGECCDQNVTEHKNSCPFRMQTEQVWQEVCSMGKGKEKGDVSSQSLPAAETVFRYVCGPWTVAPKALEAEHTHITKIALLRKLKWDRGVSMDIDVWGVSNS